MDRGQWWTLGSHRKTVTSQNGHVAATANVRKNTLTSKCFVRVCAAAVTQADVGGVLIVGTGTDGGAVTAA